VFKTDPSTWTDPRHREGARAEGLAADLFRREGYAVLEQRFRFHRHDVDLVARRGGVVVFVEVKSRSGRRYGAAAESVTARKQRELVRVAAAWLQRHGRPGDVCRFDVVTVEGARVEWLQSAFRPLWR
jgi:putative endonuclease